MEFNHESRPYGKCEFVKILSKATYSIVKYRENFRSINKEFQTNLMLAVTEVNGCQVCNYFHTKHAIDSGISDAELQSILSGDHKNVKPEEAQALFFAQHYASVKGKYSEETFDKLKANYGEFKAYGILAVIRMISFGNAYGINYGNFKDRFTKKGKVRNSKLSTELFVIISPIVLFPLTALVNAFKKKI